MSNRLKIDMKRKTTKIGKNICLYINFRVIILALVVGAIYLWFPSSFFVVHSEEFQKNSPDKNVSEILNSDIETDLYLKTKLQYCEEDKKNKRDSKLCGQSIQLDKQEELDYEKLVRPIEVKPEFQPKAQKAVPVAHKTIIRKPIIQKISCAEKNDHPGYSDTKGKHMDEDCCPDPDEWPKPGCVYSSSGRALMLKGRK
jgi:hypothetical protein